MATRALVLGGGGACGSAWAVGVLVGLADAGVDLRSADVVIGTSSGAILGTQLRGGVDLGTLYHRELVGDPALPRVASGPRLRLWRACLSWWSHDPVTYRLRVGSLARWAFTPPPREYVAGVRSRLPSDEWPTEPLLVTAVDVGSGEFFAFGAASGVPLVGAVAASTAVPGVWPPVELEGRYWMDGGLRSPANLDLACGYDQVVALVPDPTGSGTRVRIRDQVARLGDSRVQVIAPDRAARRSFRWFLLDGRRGPSAMAGRRQGLVAAEAVARVWAGERAVQP